MSKKQQQQELAATPLDASVWRVTLTVAVPNYTGTYSALDALLPLLDNEVQVLGATEDLLHLVLCADSASAVLAVQSTTTLPDDKTVDMGLAELITQTQASTVAATSPGAVKKKRKGRRGTVKGIETRRLMVHGALRALGDASAKDIAVVTGIPLKLVYCDLYILHDKKLISANKTAGKVRWLSNTANK